MDTKILIIDDNIELFNSLSANFKRIGFNCFGATNYNLAKTIILNNNINIILLDIILGKENGLEILKKLMHINCNIPVIMITGYGTIESAVESIKIGAYDYIQKPIEFQNLLKVIEKTKKVYEQRYANLNVKDNLINHINPIITKNSYMLEQIEKIKQLAPTNLPILICGENGTGKEIFADFIHENSQKKNNKSEKINCAAFPETLLDNELFGHEKGAYTGADSTFKGVFEKADKSTLFLDEIGDMSLHIQAKILRVLQNHEIRRLGSSNTITVDVRFIAATNKDLQMLISENKFRLDLYYRLNTAIIYLLPLRERKEDIPLLIEFFINEYSQKNSKDIKKFDKSTIELLIEYDWPGNVRELKNVIFYAFAVSKNDIITIDDLPSNYFKITKNQNNALNILEETEKRLLLKTLSETNNNKKETAKLLNVCRSTLYSKLKKHGIE